MSQKKQFSLAIFALGFLLIAFTATFFYLSYSKTISTDSTETSIPGAKLSFNYLGDVRSYPNKDIPKSGFSEAFQQAKRSKAKSKVTANWEAIGPTNIGGRTLALAINPEDPNTIFAGSASGGLWKSTTGGSGLNAWDYVSTGFPVLGVATVVIDPQNSDNMYIGTGESYGSPISMPGLANIRTTRGSYGIGILKSEDGGETWDKSLDWSLNQRRAVQKMLINPKRPNSVWAATTEGTYRSYDGGDNWELVHQVVMATDILMNPDDTSKVYIANGGMGSIGHGLYRSLDGGNSFSKLDLVSGGGPPSFSGKMTIDISKSNPDILITSIGNSDGSLNAPELNKTWLMKTVNGGDSWSLKSTEDYSRVQGWYAHTAKIHPQNPDIIWAAGQPFTVYKTTNGGGNLAQVDMGTVSQAGVYPKLTNWADYHDIIFHPTNTNIIYFLNDGGIFRTTDGGITFENCNSGYQTTQFYGGISNSQTNGELMLGGLQDNSSVIYEGDLEWRRGWSGDGGWTVLDPDNNNNAYLSAQFGNMVYSSSLFTNPQIGDAYFRPTRTQLPSDQTNFITPIILSPADNSTFFIGGEKILSASKGNNTWTFLGDGTALDGNAMSAMAGSYQNAEVLYVASSPKIFGSTRGSIYVTKNKGDVWTNITQDLPDRFPTDLAVDPTNDDRAFVTFGGFGTSHIFKTENAGVTWTDIGVGLPDVPTWSVAVDPENTNHIYVGNEIAVYQSQDSGNNWTNISGNLPDAVLAMELDFSNSNRMLRLATHGNGAYQLALASVVSNQNEEIIPTDFTLDQNYPNPFNPSTTIRYNIKESGPVKLNVFDINGKQVAALVNKIQTVGEYAVTFDGSNLASGTYIYKLQIGNNSTTKKMVLLK